MTARELYDRDFFQWTIRNAELLRRGDFQQADVQHLAEEIEDMGKREQRALENRLRVLLIHLLKWLLQPDRRSSSWRATLAVQRLEIADLLEQMPSLRNLLARRLEKVYEKAVLRTVALTGLPEDHFPKQCPFTLHEVLDRSFFPENATK